MTLHFGPYSPKFFLKLRRLRRPQFVGDQIAQTVLVDTIELRAQQHLLLLQAQ
ncbi:MAG TPA: hypothetical protein VFS39_15060 [Nitrospira sp.]|nr:hypothetical protein [Nitrospira sp.]